MLRIPLPLLLLPLLPLLPLVLGLAHPLGSTHSLLARHGLNLRQDVLHGLLSGPGPFPQDPPWTPDYPTSFGGYCAPNSSQTVGTFAGPTLPSVQDLLKRNAFVSRSGTGLELLGEEFRIVGANVYWLCVRCAALWREAADEGTEGWTRTSSLTLPTPPRRACIPLSSALSRKPSADPTQVIEIMGIVSAMRGTVIRGHTLGISFGNPLSIMPSPNTYNEQAYEPIDFAILMARIYGIKLLIPLVDNYNWYHGGKYQFIGWAGIPWSGTGAAITPPDVGAYFYNTSSIVDSFKAYITHHLNHVNQYTGIAYKDDPTILGWETGNELSAVLYTDGPAPPAWTSDIARLIKSLAQNHLVVDGTYGFYPESGKLQVEEVDIFLDHFYPPSRARFQAGPPSARRAQLTISPTAVRDASLTSSTCRGIHPSSHSWRSAPRSPSPECGGTHETYHRPSIYARRGISINCLRSGEEDNTPGLHRTQVS
ncbi:glycoside hydrolase family 5 protein [Calocera viscosa TUFC12733]|uniref:mannan endo-1,4-beta-mannosidase n=1 Tax=Calocera viscosa (strain TUFC12733) TaxID=1330018 RepID=A0A167HBD8_CALVF|nr:glycoside hydrolase family 5 protein [Calocera viscosa TUFC12733]